MQNSHQIARVGPEHISKNNKSLTVSLVCQVCICVNLKSQARVHSAAVHRLYVAMRGLCTYLLADGRIRSIQYMCLTYKLLQFNFFNLNIFLLNTDSYFSQLKIIWQILRVYVSSRGIQVYFLKVFIFQEASELTLILMITEQLS